MNILKYKLIHYDLFKLSVDLLISSKWCSTKQNKFWPRIVTRMTSEVAESRPFPAWHVYPAVSLTRDRLIVSEKLTGSSTRVRPSGLTATPFLRHSTTSDDRSSSSVVTSQGIRTSSVALATMLLMSDGCMRVGPVSNVYFVSHICQIDEINREIERHLEHIEVMKRQ